jgi:hypothetical protein
MAYELRLVLNLKCEDNEEQMDETEMLTSYLGERLVNNADPNRLMQSLAEALIEMDSEDIFKIDAGTMH